MRPSQTPQESLSLFPGNHKITQFFRSNLLITTLWYIVRPLIVLKKSVNMIQKPEITFPVSNMQKMTLLSTQFFTIKIKNILFLCGGKESISTMNCCGKIHTYIYISGKYYFFSLFFGPSCAACGVLVPRPEMEPLPSALGAPSLRHWTAREIPGQYF